MIRLPALPEWLAPHASLLASLSLLLLSAGVAFLLFRRAIVPVLIRLGRRNDWVWEEPVLKNRVLERSAQLVPPLLVLEGLTLIPELSISRLDLARDFAIAWLVWAVLLVSCAGIDALHDLYRKLPRTVHRPIKGYLQFFKLLFHVAGLVIVLAAFVDRSPWYFLSGIGALTAVILLVFRDTLLSLVSGLQLVHNDLLRVGDWIEMPNYQADGEVIDISLFAVRVQNGDRTVTTIPTPKFMEHAFKNQRTLIEAGGRRIKRSLHVDASTIRFLDPQERERLEGIVPSLQGYRTGIGDGRLTNLGAFRLFVSSLLDSHPGIHPRLPHMVRQKEPTAEGVPLEIYAFTRTTDWPQYERIQSDLFEHLLSIATEFGLTLYQRPSSEDVRSLVTSLRASRS